jgi:hypothetical protein
MHGGTAFLLHRFETSSLLVIIALASTLRVSATAAQQSGPSGPTAAPSVTTSPAATAPAPSAPREMPAPEQLEPGVNTSPSVSEAPTGSDTAPAAGAARTEPHNAPAPSSSSAEGTAHAKTAGEKAGIASAKQAVAGSAAHKGPDRLQLDATAITGNRELPKVLYIVPWKRSDLGDLTGRPVNSLLDEVLQPLDRDVFQRENRYYNGLKPAAAASKGEAPGGPGSKP